MSDLVLVLERLGLEKYLDTFVGEGFDSWETLSDIQESDLDALGVKLGHRRKLQRAIAESRGWSTHRPLGSLAHESTTENHKAGESSTNPGVAGEKGQNQGSEGKRKYRRHPKADENAPEKPPSAYVIFSNKVRHEIKGQELSFTNIARLVGDRWQKLDPHQKEPYETQAATMKEKYTVERTEYQKTDAYRVYQEYLADFRAKGRPPPEPKRPRLDPQSSGGSLSTASANEIPDVFPPMPGHVRGSSVGSVSTVSYGGPLPSPSSSLLPIGASEHSVVPSSAKTSAMTARMMSPSPTQFVQERWPPGRISSRSSVSEESRGIRLEQHDPLPRAATLTLTTPPPGVLGTQPAGALAGRTDLPTAVDVHYWPQRHVPPVGGHAGLASSASPPHASTFNLPSLNVDGGVWRERGEPGRLAYSAVPSRTPPHQGSLPLPSLLGSDRRTDVPCLPGQIILPPLRTRSASGAGFPAVLSDPLAASASSTSPSGLGPHRNTSRQAAGRSPENPEDEGGNTTIGYSARRPPSNAPRFR